MFIQVKYDGLRLNLEECALVSVTTRVCETVGLRNMHSPTPSFPLR